MAACSTFHFAKELSHDIPSATHDRRHAGAESRTEHANRPMSAGFFVRPAFQQIAGTAGPGGHPRLPGLSDQRKEIGAQLRFSSP